MILVSFGTRPEWIKIKPILDAFDYSKVPYRVLFTGQHEDLIKNVQNCLALNIKPGDNRLDSIVASVLNNNQIFHRITSVLVQGDTTSSFAVALAAFHRNKKIIHLEAGLRTYNKSHPYPEEFNRRSISAMADIHLCPTELTRQNLITENFKDNIFVVGNSVLDNLINLKVSETNKIIITLHRRENHDNIRLWFKEIEKIANHHHELDFFIPLHPNPNVAQHRDVFKKVRVIEPLQYEQFITEIAQCKMIITDSGGIQEEASFLGKHCLVCRDTTERPESLGEYSTLVQIQTLHTAFEKQLRAVPSTTQCPFGDGQTSKRVVMILNKLNKNERLY